MAENIFYKNVRYLIQFDPDMMINNYFFPSFHRISHQFSVRSAARKSTTHYTRPL